MTEAVRTGSSRLKVLRRVARTIRGLLHQKMFLAGIIIVGTLIIIGVFAPWVSPYPDQGAGQTANTSCPTSAAGICPPSWQHLFGTEQTGRDIMSRIFFGIRTSITISVLVVMLAVVIGLAVGLTAGYFGGLIDEALMRVTDIWLSFPHLILALVIVAVLGPGFNDILIALGATWWPGFARLARAQALEIRNRPYVIVAKAGGVGSRSIIGRHILPNAISPLLVLISVDLGAVILAEASLSFLGLGIRPPTADLGVMIAESANQITTAWWYALFPGLFLTLLVIGFNLVGDTIRDRLDPKLRVDLGMIDVGKLTGRSGRRL
ncbi:MAG TPA: ABC transporter permease [Nitrososphaerales archaeon]|nr:ABC transporter permease [Nitrososphaerales archaeon]